MVGEYSNCPIKRWSRIFLAAIFRLSCCRDVICSSYFADDWGTVAPVLWYPVPIICCCAVFLLRPQWQAAAVDESCQPNLENGPCEHEPHHCLCIIATSPYPKGFYRYRFIKDKAHAIRDGSTNRRACKGLDMSTREFTVRVRVLVRGSGQAIKCRLSHTTFLELILSDVLASSIASSLERGGVMDKGKGSKCRIVVKRSSKPGRGGGAMADSSLLL